MSESEMKVTTNGTNVFGMPLLDFSKIALPGIGGNEQVLARAREGFEKVKAASEGMTEALRETYSNNARGATDYGLKVFEISNANARLCARFLHPSLRQQVSERRFYVVRGANAQGARHCFRPEQGIVGAYPEARERNR